ncbi:MAG: NCAIR mutase (PurE)-related protein, partial [Planctomycetota bacterium]
MGRGSISTALHRPPPRLYLGGGSEENAEICDAAYTRKSMSGYPALMEPKALEALLQAVQSGQSSTEQAMQALAGWPSQDLGHSQLDLQRSLRCGHPEVVYGAGKTPGELVDIARALHKAHGRLLVTRATDEGAAACLAALPECTWHERARIISMGLPEPEQGVGQVLVLCAGTSDLQVA